MKNKIKFKLSRTPSDLDSSLDSEDRLEEREGKEILATGRGYDV